MKKTIVILLAVLTLAAALTVPAVAAETEYDEAELKAALRGAFELYSSFFDAFYEYDTESEQVEFYPDPDPELGRPYTYLPRLDKYAKWDDFTAALSEYYTSSVKELFLRKVESTEKDGKTYSCIVYAGAQSTSYLIDGSSWGTDISLDETFKVVSADGEKITASFGIYQIFSHMLEEELGVYDYTVDFVFKDGKWRVSGGEFVDKFIASRNDSPFVTAPPTGDGTVMLLALAVMSASVAFVCRRRKGRIL